MNTATKSLALLASLLYLTSHTLANPVPADELSLLNGGDSYLRYCLECHGEAPDDGASEWYESNEYDIPLDFTDLIDQAQDAAEGKTGSLEKSEWPEWAEIPDPGERASDPNVRSEIMQELVAAIDEEYGNTQEQDDGQYFELDENFLDEDYSPEEDLEEDESGRLPGVTDLTDPESFFYGTSERDLYEVIAEGTGTGMNGYKEELETEEAIWNLVNYIRSFWGEEWQY